MGIITKNKTVYTSEQTAERIEAVSDQWAHMIDKQWQSHRGTQPLFIVIGEVHERPAHELAFLSTVLKLSDKGRSVAVGFEAPHNFPDIAIEQTRKRWAERPPSDERTGQLIALTWLKNLPCNDPVKMIHIANAMEIGQTTNTFHYTAKKLNEKQIRFAFNDAARVKKDEKTLIDTSDSCTKSAMAEEQRLTANMDLDVTSRLGMLLRNKIMVQKAREHTTIQPVDIYIQHCGNAHVAGASRINGTVAGETPPYHESLVSLFRAAGSTTHGFILDSARDADSWELCPDIDMNFITLTDLGGRDFFPGTPPEQEKCYLDAVTRHLSINSPP